MAVIEKERSKDIAGCLRVSRFRALVPKIKDLVEKDPALFWKIVQRQTDFMSVRYLILCRAFWDFEFFCKFFFRAYDSEKDIMVGHCSQGFNRMHTDYFSRFQPEQKNVKEVILASRGSAKTTFFTLIDPLHRSLFCTEYFTVILSSTADLTRAKVKDIGVELEDNPMIKKYFNLKIKKNTVQNIHMVTDFGESYITGQSFFTQVRGIKRKHFRPTYFIGDDTTHGERVYSESQRLKAKRQFKTDIYNAGTPKTSYRMLGTMIHKDDLIVELGSNPTWKKFVYKAIEVFPERMDLWDEWKSIYTDPLKSVDERIRDSEMFHVEHIDEMLKGSEVLWEEREPLLHLMKEKITIGDRAFSAEKLMRPFLSDESLFKNITWFYEKDDKYVIEGTDKKIPSIDGDYDFYYALDPSTGEENKTGSTRTLSYSARLVCKKHRLSGKLYIVQMIMDRKPPSDVIEEMYQLHRKYRFVRMGVESNLFKSLFGAFLKLKRAEMMSRYDEDIRLPVYEVYASEKKSSRIYTIEPIVSAGNMLFSKKLPQEFVTQLEDYPNCQHNDGLDALEILSKIADPKNKLRTLTFRY